MAETSTPAPPYVVELAGVSNLRDIGGYLTEDGHVVRRGMVFRSAALAKLTQADIAVVDTLGLRTICDFRGVVESQSAPTPLTGPAIVNLPIEPTVGAGLRDILRPKEASGEAQYAVLERPYPAYALSSQEQYRTMLDLVADGGTPLLFHCSAGKDRTGFGAALLLTVLGVAWDTVVADFQATNRLWRRDTVPADDIPPSVRESLLQADPALLAAAFEAARRRYGSVEAFLEQALGFGPARRQRLRDVMLEEA